MRASFNLRVHPNEMSGCTAIATIATPTHILTANAGDSRALLCCGGRNVVRLPCLKETLGQAACSLLLFLWVCSI